MLIKICGLTRYEDMEFCDELGIDLVGFIFFKKSPRFVPPNKVKKFFPKNSRKVGVFVDHTIEQVLEIADLARIDLIQLHGEYKKEDCERLGQSRVIMATWPEKYNNIDSFIDHVTSLKGVCTFFLMDAGVDGGGHGRCIGKKEYLRAIPKNINWIMAGGLSPKNIESALTNLHPSGVDINSGVESMPGIKDRKKILTIYNKIKKEKR